jgi:hypothetical protein
MGHDVAGIGAIGGTDPKESIAGIGNAVQGVVVELFPKIRFGRAEMFLFSLKRKPQYEHAIEATRLPIQAFTETLKKHCGRSDSPCFGSSRLWLPFGNVCPYVARRTVCRDKNSKLTNLYTVSLVCRPICDII